MDLFLSLLGALPEPWGGIALSFLVFLGAVVTFASAIVPFTKTKTDDRIVAKLKTVFDRFSVFEPKK